MKRTKINIKSVFSKITINHVCMVIAIVIYIINKTLLSKYTSSWIGYVCKCYLNDMVCPLFFLGLSQLLLTWAGCELKSYGKLLLLGMSSGLVWEYISPIINPKAVTDPIDLICYFIGINIYYLLHKKFTKIISTHP